MKHILLLIALSVTSFGQIVNISDKTPLGSPITIKGMITFSGENITAKVVAHNTTKQDVLVNVINLTITAPSGEVVPVSIRHGHYFKPETGHEFAAGTDLVVMDTDVPHPGLLSFTGSSTPAVPRVEARAVYVELADGSTWGDSAVGTDIQNRRAKIKEFLNNLNATFMSGGMDALHAALAQKHDHLVSGMAMELSKFEATYGTEALARHIQQRLAAASQRQAKMTRQ